MAANNMTQGNVLRHLIAYTIPLVLGNVFQLMYNVTDTIIAGRFIGKEALAAAGAANPVMSIVILAISGVCMGSGVLISEFYGAGDMPKLKRAVSTTMLFGLFFSVGLAAIGVVLSRLMLVWIHVPQELLPMATAYLRIIFLGTPFTYFYNALTAAFKSIGDSTTPLRYLMIASVLNVVLDAFFIGLMGFGIVCSAVTTVVAQGVSAVLCMRHARRHTPMLYPEKGEWRIDRALLGQTLNYGSVTALMMACQPVAKVFIQGAVNALGVDTMAAFNAVERVDEIALFPLRSMGQSMATFVAQNHGAKRMDRVKEGFQTGMWMEVAYALCMLLLIPVTAKPLMHLFVGREGTESIVAQGVSYLTTMAFFYVLPGINNGAQGFFRGLGNMRMTLFCTLIQTTLRAVCTYWLAPSMGIRGVAFACAVGWTAMALYEIPSCIREIRRKLWLSPDISKT